MNPIYEKLFNTYGLDLLDQSGNFDEQALLSMLKELPLDKQAKIRLDDLFYESYLQWSADAFCTGLHLGLSLSNDEVRRLRPKKIQQIRR